MVTILETIAHSILHDKSVVCSSVVLIDITFTMITIIYHVNSSHGEIESSQHKTNTQTVSVIH